MSPLKVEVPVPVSESEPVVSELVVIDPAVTLVVDALSAVIFVAANDDEVARVVVRSVAVSEVKSPVVARMIEAKNEVVVACVPVAFTKVMFWSVVDARERMPPVAVVRPVMPRVDERVAAPETARVPVAVMFVPVMFPATWIDDDA